MEMKRLEIPKTEGLIAATFTPFAADGSVDAGVVPAYAEHLRAQGVAGVFVNGTTGEGLSLSLAERETLAEAWKAEARGLKVFVHVGHNAVPDARRLAEHAESIGADAIATVAPSFFKPGLDALVEWCAAVASAAPRTPFYLYHMPSMSGVNVSMAAFLRRAAPQIPTLAGIKFTYENLMDYMEALRLDGGRFDVLFGRDEILLAALALGARGAVGSTYNYAAAPYLETMRAFAAGDLAAARDAQARAQALVDILVESGDGIVCGKAMMPLLAGIDCGPVRSPLANFGKERLAWLARRVQEWEGGRPRPPYN